MWCRFITNSRSDIRVAAIDTGNGHTVGDQRVVIRCDRGASVTQSRAWHDCHEVVVSNVARAAGAARLRIAGHQLREAA